MATDASTKRDWVSLLLVPLILLFLGWWYTNSSEERGYEQELRKNRVDMLTKMIEHIWMNKVFISETENVKKFNGSFKEYENQNYVFAKRSLNESYSQLYGDMLKLQVFFNEGEISEISNKLRNYIAYGANEEETKLYAKTFKGKINDTAMEIQQDILKLLKLYSGHDNVRTNW